MTEAKTTPKPDKIAEVPSAPIIDQEVRISSAWIRFIRFCQCAVPYGEVLIEMKASQPTKITIDVGGYKRDVRFDRDDMVPELFSGGPFNIVPILDIDKT